MRFTLKGLNKRKMLRLVAQAAAQVANVLSVNTFPDISWQDTC